MPILQKYMMGSSAALLTCFLTAALLIIIIASARRYLDARAVGKGLSLPDGVSSWFTYAYGVVALLHLIVALTLAGDNQDMFVTVFWTGLAIPLMLLVLYHIIQGIGNNSTPQGNPSESDLISQYKATYFETLLLTAICTIFATIFAVVGSRVCNNLICATLFDFDRAVPTRARVTVNGDGSSFLSLGGVNGFDSKYALAGDNQVANVSFKHCKHLPVRVRDDLLPGTPRLISILYHRF